MVSVVAGGIFNAVAFAGAGFLFSKFNHTGYEAEMKRHNHALEQLAQAKEAWYENEIAKKDKIQRLRQMVSDANADINDTNHALEELRSAMTIQYSGRVFTETPKIADYYHSSAEMKEYQLLFVGMLGLGTGIAAWEIKKISIDTV